MATRSPSPVSVARNLGRIVDRLSFASPVSHVYNPLAYAFDAHKSYIERYYNPHAEVLLVGMNPGPWGMVQTGVPFGEIRAVKDWLGITDGVKKPRSEHGKRPIEGFDCQRSEVSGRRLWSWAQDRFGTPHSFFKHFFVWNYCPLAFMEKSGRNRTPDKLPPSERTPLFEACDGALMEIVARLCPSHVLGIGKFAYDRARSALEDDTFQIGQILHPSPASPAANRGWAAQIETQFAEIGIPIPD